MAKAKPKTYVTININSLSGAKCYIDCFPQQIWEFSVDGDVVNVCYKNLSLYIPKADFEKYWTVKE